MAVFQRIMCKVLGLFIPETALVFLDDGVVLGPRASEVEDEDELNEHGVRVIVERHMKDVARMMRALADAGLTVSGTKTHVAMHSVVVLGHQCSGDGRRPVEEKVRKIANWATPRDTTELRAFLRVCVFFRQWVKNFSTVAAPLYLLLRKNARYVWGTEQDMAFVRLKQALQNAPVLRAPDYGDPRRPLVLSTDASPEGAGGVLSQKDVNRHRYCIRFESAKFSNTQRKYSQIKRELYAVYLMVRKLRIYLYGVHFVLEVDARPLIGMLNIPKLANDVAGRWIAYIKSFDFELRHVKGVANTAADGLSREKFEVDSVAVDESGKIQVDG